MSGPAVVSVCNERYILVIGGSITNQNGKEWDNGWGSNAIFVFNVEESKFYESKVRSPIRGWCHAVASPSTHRRKSELLVSGFVHSCWNSLDFGEDLAFPECLMDLIVDCIQDDNVHVLGFGSGE